MKKFAKFFKQKENSAVQRNFLFEKKNEANQNKIFTN